LYLETRNARDAGLSIGLKVMKEKAIYLVNENKAMGARRPS